MLISIESDVASFHVQQKYNLTKPKAAPPLNGLTWNYKFCCRDGEVPLVRRESGFMTSGWATWGAPSALGEGKYVTSGWPSQVGFIPGRRFVMETAHPFDRWSTVRYRISRPDGDWFMIAACWHGAPALADRQCSVAIRPGSNLPHDLPYAPIMVSQDEWVHGASGAMSLATMKIEPV
jgi:hypothetical protein